MKIRFKKLSKNAVAPIQAYESAAGADLTATSVVYDKEHDIYSYGTGIAVEIPKQHVGYLYPRSSVYKKGLIQCNCVGVIDSDYRGEIKVNFYYKDIYPWYKRLINFIHGIKHEDLAPYKVGERCCQLIISSYTICDYVETLGKLSKTQRGEKGFGSSDKK